MTDYKLIKQLYKIRVTSLEMVEDRGYTIPEHIKKLQFENFKLLYETKNIDISFKNDDNNVYLYYHINDTKNLGKNDLKVLIKNIHEETKDLNTLIILILNTKPNASVKKELQNELYKFTEIFQRKHLVFNISKHILVPKHILLTKEEKAEVLEKYNVTELQLPKIKLNDPMAKYLGLKIGDVCKILRTTPYYRICIVI